MRFTLAPPPVCGGLLEVMGVMLARVAPSVPLGDWPFRLNLAVSIGALASIAFLMWRSSGSRTIAAATAAAIALLPPPLRSLSAPFAAAGLLAASAALARESWRIGGLVLLALIAPRTTLAMAALAAWEAGRNDAAFRWRRGIAAGVCVAGAATVLVTVLPRLPPALGAEAPARSCLLPSSPEPAISALMSLVTNAGPYAACLSVLGAFVTWRRLGPRALIPAALFTVAPALMTGDPAESVLLRGLAPAFVAFWSLVAIGLAEALRSTRSRTAGRFASIMLPALLVAFQAPRGIDAATAPPDWGHGALSFRDMLQILALAPSGTAFVDEDAGTAVLMRAADGRWQRMGKRLYRIQPQSNAVAHALSTSGVHVLVLPQAQFQLQSSGVALQPFGAPLINGVAESVGTTPCVRFSESWSEAASLIGRAGLALNVSETGAALGVLMYIGANKPASPSAVGPFPTTASWSHEIYYRSDPSSWVRFEADSVDDHLPADAAVRLAPFVTRLALWRRRAAPPQLALRLDTPSTAVWVRGTTASDNASLCGVIPFDVVPLAITEPTAGPGRH